jgi:hypothetical protein
LASRQTAEAVQRALRGDLLETDFRPRTIFGSPIGADAEAFRSAVFLSLLALLGTPAFSPPSRELFMVLPGGCLSALLADASRANHFGQGMERTIGLLWRFRHAYFYPKPSPAKPPAGFFLPRPPCFPHSDSRSLCFAAVASPPPDAIHLGQSRLVCKCLGQNGTNDLIPKTTWSDTSRRKSAWRPEYRFV